MTDTFRKEYKQLEPSVKDYMCEIKEKAEILESCLNNANEIGDHDKRMMALAKTNLEQAIMWAIKAIT